MGPHEEREKNHWRTPWDSKPRLPEQITVALPTEFIQLYTPANVVKKMAAHWNDLAVVGRN